MTNHVTEALIPSLHDSSMLNKKELVFVKVQNTLKVANKIRIFYSGKSVSKLNFDRL